MGMIGADILQRKRELRANAEEELARREAEGLPPPTTPAEEVRVARSKYPVDEDLVPAYIDQLGELTDVTQLIPEESLGARTGQAWLNMTVPDPMEIADILTSQYPDDLDVRISPQGIPVVRNKKEGFETAINKPGMSPMDILQLIGLTGQYATPQGWARQPLRRMVTEQAERNLAPTALKEAKRRARNEALTKAAIGESTTEYIAQRAQEALGGRFDPADVLLAGVAAPLPEVLFGPLAELAFKNKDLLVNGARWPDNIEKAVKFARENGYKISTSDSMSNMVKPRRRIFLKSAERLPFIGLAGMRSDQVFQRADTLRVITNRMGVHANTEYGAQILQGFVNQKGNLINQVNSLRQKTFKALKGSPDVIPTNLRQTITDLRQQASKRGPEQRQVIEDLLNMYEQNVHERQAFPFEDAAILLDDLYVDEALGTLEPGLRGEIKGQLAKSLELDLDGHAKEFGAGKAFGSWDLARNVWQKDLKKIKDTHLAKAISQGNLSHELIDDVFRNGSIKEMKALNRTLNNPGKEAVKRRLLAHAISASGGTLGDLQRVEIPRLLNYLDNNVNFQKAVKTFWNKEEQEMLTGAKEFLRYTKNAGKTMEGAGIISASGAASQIAGVLAVLFPPTWGFAGAARIHESNLVRDMFLNLKHAEGRPDRVRYWMSEIRPVLLAAGNQYLEQGRDPFTSKIEPTLLEKALMGSGKAGGQLFNAVTGIQLPGFAEDAAEMSQDAKDEMRERYLETLMNRERAERKETHPNLMDMLRAATAEAPPEAPPPSPPVGRARPTPTPAYGPRLPPEEELPIQ